MLILFVSALLSGIVDNIPYVAAMSPIVQQLTEGVADPDPGPGAVVVAGHRRRLRRQPDRHRRQRQRRRPRHRPPLRLPDLLLGVHPEGRHHHRHHHPPRGALPVAALLRPRWLSVTPQGLIERAVRPSLEKVDSASVSEGDFSVNPPVCGLADRACKCALVRDDVGQQLIAHSLCGRHITMTRQAISTDRAPAALGPYSQAVVANGWVFCSGMAGIDPATGTAPEGIESQTEQALINLAGSVKPEDQPEVSPGGRDPVGLQTIGRFGPMCRSIDPSSPTMSRSMSSDDRPTVFWSLWMNALVPIS